MAACMHAFLFICFKSHLCIWFATGKWQPLEIYSPPSKSEADTILVLQSVQLLWIPGIVVYHGMRLAAHEMEITLCLMWLLHSHISSTKLDRNITLDENRKKTAADGRGWYSAHKCVNLSAFLSMSCRSVKQCTRGWENAKSCSWLVS